MQLEVLYHDDVLLAVNKPSGMIVHRGMARDGPVAMQLARNLVGKWVYPVHRLDRGTSGVLLFALSSEIAAKIQASFNAGAVEKIYLALVRGKPEPEGIIDHAIPNKNGGPRVPARTTYRVLGTFERFAWVEARPETGRFHQIRRHFKHISHPLVGDVNYGKGDINRHFRQRFGLHRLALHAATMTLPHPTTGEPLSLRAELTPDLREPLVAMGLVESP